MGLRYRFVRENLTISKHTLNEPQHDGRVRVGRYGDTIASGMNHSAYAHLVGRQQSRSQPCSNRATNSLVRVRKSGIRESNSRRTRRAQKQRKGSPSPGIRVRTQEREGWGRGGVPLRLSRSYLVRGTDEVPNPKSEVRFVPSCSQSRLEIQNPQIRSPRWEQREQSLTQIQNPQIRSPKWSLRGKSESSQSEITKSLVQPGPGEKNSSRANPKSPNPKSDGTLGEERAMSETERVPVIRLIKSYRTRLLNPTG